MIVQVVKNLIQQLGLTEILLPFRTPDDNFAAFLKQSSIGRLESELDGIIRGRGFGYRSSDTSPYIELLDQNSYVVGILEYAVRISDDFLDRLMVPNPKGGDGWTFKRHTGYIRYDHGFLDDVVRLLESHELSPNTFRTEFSIFQTHGMRVYYQILEQYRRKYNKAHSV